MRASSKAQPNYILFSDVHLGADLVQHVRPSTSSRLEKLAKIDRDLATMLDFYREHRDPERPWCLVIAGDLVDFIGMSIAPLPDAPLETELNEEERRHGLGSARDHAVWKMRAVASRHALVFERLARFVDEGHQLVLVRGNHDVDFHWEAARDAFVQSLVDRVPELRDDGEKRRAYEARIEFHPWFYYVEGLLYVEHGHQFDAVCNYPHLLSPLRPADPKRLHWSLSDLLLRTVARPTPGLGTEGHDDRGALDYVRFAWSLGVLGMLRLAYRYASALMGAIRAGRELFTDGARALREEHERRMTELAERTRLKLDQLKALAALWPRSALSPLAVLRNAFLDRIGMGFFSFAWVLGVVFFAPPLVFGVPAVLVAIALAVAFSIWSKRVRSQEVDPSELMRRAARKIASLVETRFVVMGHTHQPLVERIEEQVTYVNLGNWGVDDLDGTTAEAPRTHLVLRVVDGEHQAQFVAWDPDFGPRPVG